VILRNGKRKTITAELEERPTDDKTTTAKSDTLEQLGFSVQNLTDELAERLGYQGQSGVVVSDVEPGSMAGQAGISAGTLVVEVNRKPVKNTKDFDKALEQAGKEGSVLLLVKNRRYTRYVVLTLPKK